MANSPQARKRARQAQNHRTRNVSHRSKVRTYVKKVVAAVDAGDSEAANAALAEAIPVIDKMAGKGIVHRNKAARQKSRMTAKVNALSTP